MAKLKNQSNMATRIGVIRHHSANQREELEGLFPVAYELIQRALRVVDDGVFKDVAQPFRDTFKSEAQTFLDAARLISRDASAADTHRPKRGLGRRPRDGELAALAARPRRELQRRHIAAGGGKRLNL
jgi:hypothetical protein